MHHLGSCGVHSAKGQEGRDHGSSGWEGPRGPTRGGPHPAVLLPQRPAVSLVSPRCQLETNEARARLDGYLGFPGAAWGGGVWARVWMTMMTQGAGTTGACPPGFPLTPTLRVGRGPREVVK